MSAKDLMSSRINSPEYSSSVNSLIPSIIPGTNLFTSGNAKSSIALDLVTWVKISAKALTFASTKKFSKFAIGSSITDCNFFRPSIPEFSSKANTAAKIVFNPSTSSPQLTPISSKSSAGISISRSILTSTEASLLPLDFKILSCRTKSNNLLKVSVALANNKSPSSAKIFKTSKLTNNSAIVNIVTISSVNCFPVKPISYDGSFLCSAK